MGDLINLNLSLFDTPREDQVQEQKAAAPALNVRTTQKGTKILVYEDHPAPDDIVDQAIRRDLALFTVREVGKMREADQEAVDAILATKKVFPGCKVRAVVRSIRGG